MIIFWWNFQDFLIMVKRSCPRSFKSIRANLKLSKFSHFSPNWRKWSNVTYSELDRSNLLSMLNIFWKFHQKILIRTEVMSNLKFLYVLYITIRNNPTANVLRDNFISINERNLVCCEISEHSIGVQTQHYKLYIIERR